MVTRAHDWDPSPPAPGELEAVRRFVNTLDCYRARDDLVELADAREALQPIKEQLSFGAVALVEGDLVGLRTGRAGLRAALGCPTLWGSTGPHLPEPDGGSVRVLLRADATGVHVTDVGATTEALVGRLLLGVLHAQHDGTVTRLKVCANPGCQWAFWDSSRPGSARWCSMRVCGGQAKARRYRERHSSSADA